MKLLVVTVIISLFVAGQCGRTEVDDSYFDYPYEKVLDYYVIQAWHGLNDTVPAYTPEMIARHTQLVLDLPWAGPTPSAEDDGVLGQTPGWPRNTDYPNDPEIPPQNIYGYQITDPKVESPKVKMIMTSGQHATEFTGNWILEGMVNFLAGSDPRAVFLRTRAVFYVYPDLNPEGRYMAVHRINLEAAPDPNAGTNMRKRGNPELYAGGEKDHNRMWRKEFYGKFSTIDVIRSAWEKDTGNQADYFWDMHGPQEPANWRTPSEEARTNEYAKALMKREPDVIRCGPESGFKVNVASGPEGKISLYLSGEEGLHVTYPYVYEPGGWSRERLLESGKNLALALHDILTADKIQE